MTTTTTPSAAPPTPAAIELVGVTRRFGSRTILDQVDLRIARGRTTALLGPSGTGKSTLLRLATGLLPPDAGVVRIDDGRHPG